MQYNASALHRIAEVQKTNHWRATFSGPPFAGFEEAIQMRLVSVDAPKPKINDLDVTVHGFKFTVPGTVSYNQEIKFKCFESITGEIDKAMAKWYDDIYSRTSDDVEGKQRVSYDDLFASVKLELLNAEETKVTRVYDLKACLITSYDSGGSLDDGADGADYYKPEFELAVNWYTQINN